MNKDFLNKALEIEQLEDRFEMTVAALDGTRCTANGNDVDATVAPSTIGVSENP
jgi:hypothetical protein